MNAFEKACNDVDDELYSDNIGCENVLEFVRDSKTATVSFSQKRFVTKIKKLAEKHPDKVQIVHENEDGSIVAHIPVSSIHISIMQREMSDEERAAAAERLRQVRDRRNSSM